jgi:pimeloyl-ACP methyl ester carboxylesterase
MHVQRRAIGAEDLRVGAHIEEDVRVIEGIAGPHALKLLDTDQYFFSALVVGDMGHEVSGHGRGSCQEALRSREADDASLHSRSTKKMIEVLDRSRARLGLVSWPTSARILTVEFFDSDGVSIAYLDEGPRDGAPIILIHGFASSVADNWVNPGWVLVLSEAGYRVIALDNRGHGESAKLYTQDAYATPVMAEDVRRLMDHLEIKRADIMGYSMGARMAAFLGINHQRRVRSIVFGGLGINMLRGLAGTGPIAHALEAESIAAVTNPTARTFRAFAEQTGSDLKALAQCIRAIRVPITAEMLQHLTCPVLVAVGSEDVIGGSATELAALIPGAEALDIPRRDHMRAVGDKVYKFGVLEFLAKRP